MGEENKGNNNFFKSKLFSYAVIALVVSAAVFLSYFTVKNLDVVISYVAAAIGKFFSAITPLILGIIFAYLFNRPVMFFEKLFGKVKARRVLSIGILYILILGTISLAINFIVPGIQSSLVMLMNIDLPSYATVISTNFQQTLGFLKSLGITIDFNNLQSYILQVTSLSSVILDGVMSLVKVVTQGIFNFVLAMILAFYILQKKERLLGSIKELITLYGSKRVKNYILSEAKEFNSILNSYVSGMLTDAIIVSLLVTIGLKLIGHKYFLLMGVSIGLLNLIPYFGSILGCVIAALLALFQGMPLPIYTLVTIIVIMQIDANIIQPRIVGQRVGLEPLWVITAVIVFGSYWGILGMIIAVPTTALIRILLKRLIEKRREKARKSDACAAPDKKD